MTEDRAIVPGDTIGILGGGQLARMLAIAAAQLGLKSHIYAPPGDNPAVAVAAAKTIADYDDLDALAAFAGAVSVVTYEFENVPAETVAAILPQCPVRPSGHALGVTQDRLTEKQFLRSLGMPTAPFAAVDDDAGLRLAAAEIGLPAILKTRRFGYDGKGQVLLRTDADLEPAFASLGRPSILEGLIPFTREVSMLAARGVDGGCAAFDLCENRHRNHILSATMVPAEVREETETEARSMTIVIAEALDYVGVIAVEMFVTEVDGAERLVINEIAPRVHNSGHWTIEGAATSQFTQHVRAICGWPLGSTRPLGTIEMLNLVGDEADNWAAHLAEDGTALHLYGKAETRPGRKMGHLTRVRPFTAAAPESTGLTRSARLARRL